MAGCAGVRSAAPQKEEQGHTEATKEQTRSPEATASEEARCSQTRTYKSYMWVEEQLMTTNDVPGCPKGGLLSGTDKKDRLGGKDGDDEIHGLGATDFISGGIANDVIYGGPGVDFMGGDEGDDVLYGGDGNDGVPGGIGGGKGEDVLYGGKGNDWLEGDDRFGTAGPPMTMRDELYCGPGKDMYHADSLDYVDSSCEKEGMLGPGGTL
jgi:hypothetical protein